MRRTREELGGRPAGEILATILWDAEQRAKIRAYRAATGIGQERLAAEIGVSLHRLRVFLAGTEVTGDDAERIDVWCEDKPTPFIHPEDVAVLILARWGTFERRAADRKAFAHAVLAVYKARSIRLPPDVVEAIRGP